MVGKVKSSDCIIQLQCHPKISDLVSIINDFISIHRENLTVSLVFDETPLHPNRSPYKIKPKLVSG